MKIGRIYQGLNEIQKYYQGGVLQKLFFDWKHYIGTELNIEYAKECAGRNTLISGKTYQNLVSNLSDLVGKVYTLKSSAKVISNLLKVSTTYTFIFNISEANYSDTNFGAIMVVTYPTLSTSYINISRKNGIFKIKYTIKEEIPKSILISPHANNDATSSFKLDNLIILEGDYTNIDLPTSIDGIESVGEKEDINLLKNIAWYDGFINLDTGEVDTSTSYPNAKYSELIDININQLYKTNIVEHINGLRIRAYRADDIYIRVDGTFSSFSILYEKGGTYPVSKIRLLLLNVEAYPLPAKPYVIRNEEDINYPYPINLNNRGKNLFNPNNLEYGNMNKDTGENLATVQSMKRTIDLIKVNPKTQYIINTSCRVFEYDKDKSFLSSTAMAGRFTTSENTEYIKFHGNTTKEFVDDKKIQLEEGTVATSYEPYREPIITNINLPIPLRSLPNGVCDTVEGNKLIQRVGKVVLDGHENWILQSCDTNGNGILNIYFIIQDLKLKEKQFIICDKYIQQKTAIANTTKEGILVNEEKRLYLRLFTSKATTVAEAKEYIKNNPFTVYYELATPIETEITPNMILINGESITDTVGIELPNGTKDSIENDYYVKRVGKVTYNGQEDWKFGTTAANIKVFYLINTDFKELALMLCDSYKVQVTTLEDKSIYCGNSWRPQIRDDSCSTVDEFKQLLSENPVTVWYELATPVKIPLFSIKEGLTTLKSTNNITPQIELDCLVRNDFQNMCDNKWESGDIDLNTGVNKDRTDRIRLINYIKVKPNTSYKIDITNLVLGKNIGLRCYDISKTYISGGLIGDIKSSTYTFTTPENCYYIRFIVETTDINFKIYLKEVLN